MTMALSPFVIYISGLSLSCLIACWICAGVPGFGIVQVLMFRYFVQRCLIAGSRCQCSFSGSHWLEICLAKCPLGLGLFFNFVHFLIKFCEINGTIDAFDKSFDCRVGNLCFLKLFLMKFNPRYNASIFGPVRTRSVWLMMISLARKVFIALRLWNTYGL